MARTHGTALERFFARVEEGPDGCWLWTGWVKDTGYAVHWVSKERRWMRAHRYAYEAIVGPIPDGMVIDHLCGVKHCVNPAHLEAVSQRENMHRHYGKQLTCHNGHPREGVGAKCRECARARSRRHYRKHRAARG